MSPIERRLAELQREMASVRKGLKTAARESPGPVAAGPADARSPLFREPPPPAPAAGVPEASGVNPADGDLFRHAARAAGAADQSRDLFPDVAVKSVLPARPAPLSAPAAAPEPRSGRERFAHYFMAGHFSNLRPLRQESRVVRNKAILMLIAVAIALGWLLYFLRGH